MLRIRGFLIAAGSIVLSVGVSGCATKTYGRQSTLTEFEKKTMSCREIHLEMAKTQGFIDHVNKESEFSGRDVLAFLADFGIGNAMERTSAMESATRRIGDLQDLSATKQCVAAGESVQTGSVQTAAIAAAVPSTGRMPRQGDTWTYRLIQPDRAGGSFKTRRYDVAVASVSGNAIFDQFILEGGSSGHSAHDGGKYLTLAGVPLFSPYLPAFEDLGKSGSLGPIEIKSEICKTSLCEVQGRIVGYETITVKAGTFEAVKVVVDHYSRPLVFRGGGQAPMGWTDARRVTVWYSPAVKRAVKFSSRATLGSNPREESHYDLELESYRLQ